MIKAFRRAHAPPLFAALVGALCLAGPVQAQTTATYSGSIGNRAASAVFTITGSTLHVVLTNTSSSDILVPTDVLTGLFFDTTHTLVPVSASLNGSTVWYNSLTNNVGEGWQYVSGVSAQGKNAGISASGLGVFGTAPSFFSPPVLPLDGLNYGILSAGDNTATGNTGVKGHGPLIKNSIDFTLTAASGFSLSELGSKVVFQYGTALTEPHFDGNKVPDVTTVPEPASLSLLLPGLIPLGFRLRRRRSS